MARDDPALRRPKLSSALRTYDNRVIDSPRIDTFFTPCSMEDVWLPTWTGSAHFLGEASIDARRDSFGSLRAKKEWLVRTNHWT